jgi:hypothetical protein
MDLPAERSKQEKPRTVTDIILEGKRPPERDTSGGASGGSGDLQSELATGAKKNIQAQQDVMWTYVRAMRKLVGHGNRPRARDRAVAEALVFESRAQEQETVFCIKDTTCQIPKTSVHRFWADKLNLGPLLPTSNATAAPSNSTAAPPTFNSTADPDFGADVAELTVRGRPALYAWRAGADAAPCRVQSAVTNRAPDSAEDEARRKELKRTAWFLKVTVFEYQRLVRSPRTLHATALRLWLTQLARCRSAAQRSTSPASECNGRTSRTIESRTRSSRSELLCVTIVILALILFRPAPRREARAERKCPFLHPSASFQRAHGRTTLSVHPSSRSVPEGGHCE